MEALWVYLNQMKLSLILVVLVVFWSDAFFGDGAVISLGNDDDVLLAHVADAGVKLNSTRQIQFGDAGTYLHQSADGVLDLVADGEVEINGGTVDINGTTSLENATIDFVKIDGTYIGHTDDTDLINLSNGTVTVLGTVAATAVTGDGSGLTGVSAGSIASDNLTQGDAAVTLSTSSGAVNITPGGGSAIVLDGAINVDAGIVTGATSITSATQIASTSVQTPLIEYTDGDDATSGTSNFASNGDRTPMGLMGNGTATVSLLQSDDTYATTCQNGAKILWTTLLTTPYVVTEDSTFQLNMKTTDSVSVDFDSDSSNNNIMKMGADPVQLYLTVTE